MRYLAAALSIGLAAVPACVLAQTKAPAAPAAKAAHYTTDDTDVGTLLDDPASKAVLAKYIPDLISSPQIDMARSLTLKAMQGYAPDKLSDKTLAQIDVELAKIPAK